MFDAIIIGAGQAGLAMGFHLHKQEANFLIIGQEKRIGDTWRERYDSLVLFTPREFSSLPGLMMTGDQTGFPSKDEVADYLETYAQTYQLPVQLETKVESLEKVADAFVIHTNQGKFHAKRAIVATGPFQVPTIPEISNNLSATVFQLHSSQYKNKTQLKPGNVLVVGGGNSGAQIAVELAKVMDVHLSVSHKIRFLPVSFAGNSLFRWFKRLGILNAKRNSWIGKKLRKSGDPIFGRELKKLIENKSIKLHPRTTSCKEQTFIFEDQQEIDVDNVIWATGFHSNYDWINIKNVVDEDGNVLHNRGITNVEGLYFLGKLWQYRRGSALLLGVGEDAAYIAKQIH